MKKIFTLLVAMTLMATSFAQVSVRNCDAKVSPFNGKYVEKSLKSAEEGWISTGAFLEGYWGEISAGDGNYLSIDSLGLLPFGDSYSHPWFFSVSQTFDFTANFWDEASMEGELSLVNTNSFNIDSVAILALYIREDDYPASAVDTLIVGITTNLIESEAPVYQFTNYENSCFYGLDYDAQNGVPVGAQIFKVPLDASAVSQPAEEEGYYTLSEINVPVNLTNVTGKAWNIAYSFKSGNPVGLNDTLKSHFNFTTWKSPDPNYSIDANNPNICENLTHGQYNNAFTNGTIDYYYPAFAYTGADFHYPRMFVKVSCADCAYVNVEDMEKENITVYPNPASNNITINTGSEERALVEMYNLVGQKVYSENVVGTTTINVSNMKAGVYMLRVNNHTTKVVVK